MFTWEGVLPLLLLFLDLSIPGCSGSEALPTAKTGFSLSRDPDFEIHIFAWKRTKSLKRLLDSIKVAQETEAAGFDGPLNVPIYFHVDYGHKPEVLDVIAQFRWGHGRVHVNVRKHRYGMPQNILLSWHPTGPNRYALFLEDDLAVSPFFMLWTRKCIEWLDSASDRGLVGCSLYTPMVNEIGPAPNAWSPPKWSPQTAVGADACFYFQLPCSWGAVYSSTYWLPFLQYYMLRSSAGPAAPDPPNSRTIEWFASWKRYLIELMLEKKWFLLYPLSGPDFASFSTNYFEQGVHSVPDGQEPNYVDSLKHSDRRFTVPLIVNRTAAVGTIERCGSMPSRKHVSLYHQRVGLVSELGYSMGTIWRERQLSELVRFADDLEEAF